MSYGFIRISENEYACVVDGVIVAVKETAQHAGQDDQYEEMTAASSDELPF
jgi:hypothetical protein